MRKLILYIQTKMRRILSLIVFWIAFTAIGLSQGQYINEEIKILFSTEDKSKVEEAERMIKEGNMLMNEAEAIEQEYKLSFKSIEDYNEEKIRLLKQGEINVLKRSTRRKIRASNQYSNANMIMIAILKKYINRSIDKNSEYLTDNELETIFDLTDQSLILLNKALSTRDKAIRMQNELLLYPYLIEANELSTKSLNKLQDAFAIILKPAVINELKKDKKPEIKNIKAGGNVYYRIQIAASQTRLSVKQLENIYPDLSIISSEYENGWYKYSIRKNFKTYEEATQYKNTLNIAGVFIIAYVNGEKVPVSKAIEQEKN